MIEGCQIFLPDTVFFERGKAVICAMDKEFCLAKDTKKPGPLAVRQHLADQVAERKEKTAPFWLQEACNKRKRAKAGEQAEGKADRGSVPRSHDRLARAKPAGVAGEKGGPAFSRDHAIVRFIREDKYGMSQDIDSDAGDQEKGERARGPESRPPAALQVLPGKGTALSALFGELAKANARQKDQIEYIQTCVRHSCGIGDPIDVHFKAPLDDSSREAALEEVAYDWKGQGDELSLLQAGEFKKYAYQQCLKICHYVKKVRNKEILKMRAEFLKDSCGNVWFSYASGITYRECGGRVAWKEAGELNDEQVLAHQRAQQDMLRREMEQYQREAKFDKAKDLFIMKQMHGFMEDYYEGMKKELGIDASYRLEEQDPPLAEVLAAIRPNVTAKNFKEYL